MSNAPERVVVEADGGSRGNPGPAAYGALLRDADTGALLAESAATLGTATNNVAEYRGLIAGLELVREHAPEASLEVRMDSKLVIEQMAGRWKVKHASMRPLAIQARRLAPEDTVWTWVPRAENAAADALVNAVLDGTRAIGVTRPDDDPTSGDAADEPLQGTEPAAAAPQPAPHDPLVGWRRPEHGTPTTLLLLRHGVTASTEARLFCGSGGTDPGLTATGRQQAERAAGWLERRGDIDHVVASPLQRAQETAETAAARLRRDIVTDPAFAELRFGEWDGLTIDQVRQRWPDHLVRWFADEHEAPPGGESLAALEERVVAGMGRLLEAHAGETVLVVSHVTPIKAVVRRTLDAPVQVVHRMQLAAASITVVQWWPDGVSALRTFSHVPD